MRLRVEVEVEVKEEFASPPGLKYEGHRTKHTRRYDGRPGIEYMCMYMYLCNSCYISN